MTAVYDTVKASDAHRNKECTLGLHPTTGCICGGYAHEQCCVNYHCRKHKCGPRVGCRCPLPEKTEEETI